MKILESCAMVLADGQVIEIPSQNYRGLEAVLVSNPASQSAVKSASIVATMLEGFSASDLEKVTFHFFYKDGDNAGESSITGTQASTRVNIINSKVKPAFDALAQVAATCPIPLLVKAVGGKRGRKSLAPPVSLKSLIPTGKK